MGGAERVVTEDFAVAEFSEFLGEFFLLGLHFGLGSFLLLVGGVVGQLGLAFFFLIETGVFDHHDFAGLERLGLGDGFRADAVGAELNRLAEQFFQFGGNRLQAKFGFVAFAFRAAEVAHQYERTALSEHIVDSRNRGGDTGEVAYVAFFNRHIKIYTHQNPVTLYVHITNRHLFHSSIPFQRLKMSPEYKEKRAGVNLTPALFSLP